MIFLSYSWEDWEKARSIHRLLTQSGFQTWIDFEQLDLDSDIASQLKNAVLASQALLFIDSPNARLSQWARFERAIAKRAQIPVVRIDANPRPDQHFRIFSDLSIPSEISSRLLRTPLFTE
jgi:hypothetical protein